MAAYMRSLEKLIGREDRLYLPGHGPEVTNPRKLVRGMLAHRRQRERQIVRQLEAGPTDIDAMVAVMYAGIDPRLHPAAARSVLAHLIDLEERGLAVRNGERWQSGP
jgi:glyoxylase-like metal-dependent hydrolase (beta-lactamase superfamily II)